MEMGRWVALTGAGISKASGIPTFEELGDLREKLSRSYFQQYPEQFYLVLKEMKKKVDQAQPNPAHRALAEHNIPVITMNIDGLHYKAGSSNVLEIHGNLRTVCCRRCGRDYDFNEVYKSIYCTECGSVLEHEGGCVICRNCGYSKCG
jgi:NAD-dependent deacetylase